MLETEKQHLIKEQELFDTPTVTNVVATYPGAPTCLSLYSPWEDNWYTDQTLRTAYPELGRTCGYAVTCTYGLPEESDELTMENLLTAIRQSQQPVVLLIHQDFPEKLKGKVGLCGGNMSTAFKSMGCVGIITDGPSRDVHEVREMGIQYMMTGVTAGHGPFALKAVNTPVNICGMDICPGEVVHMDENGAMKFPAEYLDQVVELCRKLNVEEQEKQARVASTDDPVLAAKYLKGQYS